MTHHGARSAGRGLLRHLTTLASTLVLLAGLVAVASPTYADDDQAAATVQGLIDANSTGGTNGYYLREVDGPVHAASNSSTVWEPASAIKALIFAHAMRAVDDGAQVNGGTVTLTTQVPSVWVLPGTSSTCPTNTGNTSMSLANALSLMMFNSDNRWTQALRDYFGDAAIMQTAADLGMDDTVLQHLIGCRTSQPPAGFLRGIDFPNALTLVDVATLWEQMSNGYLADWDAARTVGSLGINTLDDGAANAFASITTSEAAGLGLSNATLAEFAGLQQSAVKPGTYTSAGVRLVNTIGGWAEIPFKDAFCVTDVRQFVYGVFIDSSTTDSSGLSTRVAASELMRERIREALQTWVACEADLALTELAFVDPPDTLDVSTATDLTVRHRFTNLGPAESTGVLVDADVTVPADCTADPASYVVAAEAPVGTVVTEERTVSVTCTQPSNHQISVEAEISPLLAGTTDPDPSNDTASATIQPAVVAYADLAVTELDDAELAAAGLGDLLVGGQWDFAAAVTAHNAGDIVHGLYDDPVSTVLSRGLTADAGMTATVTVTDAEAPALVRVQPQGQAATFHFNQPAGATWSLEGPGEITVESFHTLAPDAEASVDARFALACTTPGLHDVELTAAIVASDPHVLDPAADDNTASAARTVECVTPVAVNVRPGNDKNAVRAGTSQKVPVSILTTGAGEYGFTDAFDASWVDPATARFGAPDTLAGGGGGLPFPEILLAHDSFEPDDVTRDGDTDVTLPFGVIGSGLTPAGDEACVTGSWSPDGVLHYTFYGCDTVTVS